MVTEINSADIYSTALTVTATVITLLFTLKEGIDKRFKNPEPAQYFSVEGSSARRWNDVAEINLCSFIILMGSILVFLLALGLVQFSLNSATHDTLVESDSAKVASASGERNVSGDAGMSIEPNSSAGGMMLDAADGSSAAGTPTHDTLVESDSAKVASASGERNVSGDAGMSIEPNSSAGGMMLDAADGSSAAGTPTHDTLVESDSAKVASASGERNVSGDAGMSIEPNSSAGGMMLDAADGSSAAGTPAYNDKYQSPKSFRPELEVPEFLYAAWLIWLFFCILFMGRLSLPQKQE